MPSDHLSTTLIPVDIPTTVNENASSTTNIPGALLLILVTSLAVVGMNVVGVVIGAIGCMGWGTVSEHGSGEGMFLFLVVSKKKVWVMLGYLEVEKLTCIPFVPGKVTQEVQNTVDDCIGDGRGDTVALGIVNPRGDTA